MRKYGKVDTNHKEIVEALRKFGASVISLAPVGGGVPDLLVGKGINFIIEVKKDSKSNLTPAQEKFFKEWKGFVFRVNSAEEAIEKIQLKLKELGLLK